MKLTKLALISMSAAMLAGPVLPVLAANGGWQKSGNDYWYLNEDGTHPKDTWQKIDGKWYRFNADGWMVRGWKKVGDQ